MAGPIIPARFLGERRSRQSDALVRQQLSLWYLPHRDRLRRLSPALGFIHTGKMLSFVYDIADLYQADLTIPLGFKIAAAGKEKRESCTRHACRDIFYAKRLLARIVDDSDAVLTIPAIETPDFDADFAAPGGRWDPDKGEVAGGITFADEPEEV